MELNGVSPCCYRAGAAAIRHIQSKAGPAGGDLDVDAGEAEIAAIHGGRACCMKAVLAAFHIIAETLTSVPRPLLEPALGHMAAWLDKSAEIAELTAALAALSAEPPHHKTEEQ